MTRLLEILISLAIVAALFLVVGLVLPSSRHLAHSVETNRKMSIVFDTLNGVRRFKDWNPLVLRDPAMQIKISGPTAGVGARLDYVSQEKNLGTGSWELVESEKNKRIAFALENPAPGKNKRMEFLLTPTGRNNRNVEIMQTYDVDYGFNLLGRYAGLYVASNVGEDIKLGLSRLGNMLATVPNFDYNDLSKGDPSKAPKLAERGEENLLVVTAAVPRGDDSVRSTMNNNYQWIKKVMDANGLEAAGPVRIVTNEFGSTTYSFDVVQSVRKAGATGKLDIKLEGPVTANYTAPGKIVTVPFSGHMAGLNRVRDALRGWAVTQGYETSERPYELWKAGIDNSFSEAGDYEVVWAIK